MDSLNLLQNSLVKTPIYSASTVVQERSSQIVEEHSAKILENTRERIIKREMEIYPLGCTQSRRISLHLYIVVPKQDLPRNMIEM